MTENTELRVLGIDPGGTTGLCFMEGTATNGFTVAPWQKRVAGHELLSILNELDLTDVVYETFEFRRRTRSGVDLTAKELIGIIKLYEHGNPHVKVVAQSPMTGKSFFTNDALRERGLFVKGRLHSMDATRHVMQWLTFGAGYRYIGKVRDPMFTIKK